MNKSVRVNVRTRVNSDGIRRERRNGRDYIIVPSATLPDDVVMNKIRYPSSEIAKGFSTLENTPAPLGHPNIEGAFVSAKDPEGLARGWIGAWNRNVRRENGRVFLDKVIDVATASQLEGGKAVLEAIEKGEPIHTSTGLYCILTEVKNDSEVQWEASDIVFDHDAILLGEAGAATPEQGVGMMVNAKAADGQRIEAVNSALEDADRELDWIADAALRAAERMDRVPLVERMKLAILEAVKGANNPEPKKEKRMDDAQYKKLEDEVKAMSKGLEGLGETISNAVTTALKPLTDQLTANAAAEKAKAEADKAALVKQVVESGVLTEELANASSVEVLNALVSKGSQIQKPGVRINSAPITPIKAGFGAGYKAPKGDK